MRGSVKLITIFGIPIRLNISWFLVAALVTVSLAGNLFPRQYPGWESSTYWMVGVLTALFFFASVLIHELGHAVVAIREKVPVRGITLFMLGGVAEVEREPETAGSEFRIAIAGPVTSVALGLFFLALGSVLTPVLLPWAAAAIYLGQANLILAVFNLIPGFPLDGGRVLRAILWKYRGNFISATRWATQIGRGVAFMLIGLGVLQLLLGSVVDGLWIAFIGWFLNSAAQSSYRQVVLREMLAGVTAREVPAQSCALIPASEPLDNLIVDRVLGAGEQCFYVTQDGQVEGMLTLNQIRAVPRSRWAELTTEQVMTPAYALAWANPEEDLYTLLQRMDESKMSHLPLKEDGRLLGMITRDGLLRHIRLRQDLGLQAEG